MNNNALVVVVTGASAGLGRAIVREFAREGASIGLLARGRDRLEDARREVEALGGRALVLPTDVADAEAVEGAAEAVERELGPIDIWVNNAMATIFAPFDQVTPEEFKRATEVTYLGYVHGTMAALKRMKLRDRGVIVQVGSALSYRSIPLQSAYCGARHAVVGFTDSIRSELLRDGSNVHITIAHMPALNTPQFEWSRNRMPRRPQPVPPIFQPEVAARAVVWAARHRRRELSVGLPTVIAIQGQKIAPGLADRYLAKTGYESQQTNEPSPPDRLDNLFSPLPGDYGAHGRFDERAKEHSLQFWLNRNRSLLALVGGGLTGLAIGALSRRRSWHGHDMNVHRLLATFAGSGLAGALAAFVWKWRGVTRATESPLHIRGAETLPVFAQNRSDIIYAWRGPSLLVVDNQGCAGKQHRSGFFFREARYLSELRLEIQGESPFSCSLAAVAANELEFNYVYPEKEGGGSDRGGEHRGVIYGNLDLRLSYRVSPCGLIATLWITNRWQDRVEVDVAWALAADFADTGELHGERRQRAEVEAVAQPNGVSFRYRHPEIPMETRIVSEGAAWSFADGLLSARVALERQATVELRLRALAVDARDPLDEREAARREERLRDWQRDITRVEAAGETPLAEIVNRAMGELGSMALLEGREDEWLAPAAGMPGFPSLWGRDALTAVWQASVFDRGEMAAAVLSRLGRMQGRRVDPWRDEQPGRIIRAAQTGPLVRLGQSPFDRYYGDFASPFDFIFALGQLYAWSGDKRQLKEHWDAARRVMDWAREYGDPDGDGYLEYQTQSEAGPTHQGWKDSENAIVDADGRQVAPPIAPCEIQGYYFVAQQFMAAFALALGAFGEARAFWNSAREFKRRFNRDFWMEDESYVAFGLDAEKRQIRSVTSNAGQCLTTGVVDDDKLPRLAHRIFQPDMFSGWGIRTLSSKHPAYNPLSYHLGSVWAVENGTILFGLRRFGFNAEALRLARALYDLALLWRGHRIPECVGGYDRSEAPHPGAFPQANVPQSWNLSVFPILLQTLLGLRAAAPLKLLAVDPVLPEWLPDVTVRNLRVGRASVSLRFWRARSGESRYEVLKKDGALRIVRQPPLDSLTASLWERLDALIKDG
jgi:glycogen debranching enzyme/NAD(P)-dependent dehydrogenase (short-subunit alcohol dehydrogenase family)